MSPALQALLIMLALMRTCLVEAGDEEQKGNFNLVKLLIPSHQSHETLLTDYKTPIPLAQESKKSSIHEDSSEWSYNDPDAWTADFKQCGGHLQSPVNLNPFTAQYINYSDFVFGNYDKVAPMNITNNGHSVLLHLPDDYPKDQLPYVTGGGLEGRYNFVQLHFHWGSDSSQGSEHLINFRPYAAELHIVHYAQKYGTIAEATKYKDGLAVIGILIETQARDNVAFRHIVKQFSQILEVGVEANLASPIPLEDLLPDDTNNFYRYNGSLTTPGCEEIVIWTVFDTPIAVSQQQLSKFRMLVDPHGHKIVNNYRPLHLINDRNVTFHSTDGSRLRFPTSRDKTLAERPIMKPPPTILWNLLSLYH